MKRYFSILITVGLFISLFACQTPADEGGDQVAPITTYILVRHAEKANDGTRDPDLNEQGKQRAERLAKMLLPAKVSAIYSTNYKRTQQTAMPLAKKLDLEIKTYEPFQEKDLTRIQESAAGKTVLIVGHSNTTPAMLNQLLGKERYDQLDDDEYDKLFIVTKINEQGKVTILSF